MSTCQARIANGQKCRRQSQSGSTACWQHRDTRQRMRQYGGHSPCFDRDDVAGWLGDSLDQLPQFLFDNKMALNGHEIIVIDPVSGADFTLSELGMAGILNKLTTIPNSQLEIIVDYNHNLSAEELDNLDVNALGVLTGIPHLEQMELRVEDVNPEGDQMIVLGFSVPLC